jgi:magnesium chelatase family protein
MPAGADPMPAALPIISRGFRVRSSTASVAGAVLEDVARPDASGLALLREAADAMRLSARGYHRVLRVARTLADLDGADKVGRMHLAEALSYRALADEARRAA